MDIDENHKNENVTDLKLNARNDKEEWNVEGWPISNENIKRKDVITFYQDHRCLQAAILEPRGQGHYPNSTISPQLRSSACLTDLRGSPGYYHRVIYLFNTEIE